MNDAVFKLMTYLQLDRVEDNVFRGESPQTGRQRIFGGQVIAQCVVAACRTVARDRFMHSLHAYFMRPGDPTTDIRFEVDRLRDGTSFNTRRVVAYQHGKAIFTLAASFQRDEDGLDHQVEMPGHIPQPEDLQSEQEFLETLGDQVPESIRTYWRRERPIELRPTDLRHYLTNEKLKPEQNIWVRATGPVPDNRIMQTAMLAYLSDMTVLDTSLFVHGRSIFDPELQVASLDHSMWFHRQTKLDDWLLYTQDSPSSGGSRGFTRGTLYDRSGRLIASVAQEGLIRKV